MSLQINILLNDPLQRDLLTLSNRIIGFINIKSYNNELTLKEVRKQILLQFDENQLELIVSSNCKFQFLNEGIHVSIKQENNISPFDIALPIHSDPSLVLASKHNKISNSLSLNKDINPIEVANQSILDSQDINLVRQYSTKDHIFDPQPQRILSGTQYETLASPNMNYGYPTQSNNSNKLLFEKSNLSKLVENENNNHSNSNNEKKSVKPILNENNKSNSKKRKITIVITTVSVVTRLNSYNYSDYNIERMESDPLLDPINEKKSNIDDSNSSSNLITPITNKLLEKKYSLENSTKKRSNKLRVVDDNNKRSASIVTSDSETSYTDDTLKNPLLSHTVNIPSPKQTRLELRNNVKLPLIEANKSSNKNNKHRNKRRKQNGNDIIPHSPGPQIKIVTNSHKPKKKHSMSLQKYKIQETIDFSNDLHPSKSDDFIVRKNTLKKSSDKQSMAQVLSGDNEDDDYNEENYSGDKKKVTSLRDVEILELSPDLTRQETGEFFDIGANESAQLNKKYEDTSVLKKYGGHLNDMDLSSIHDMVEKDLSSRFIIIGPPKNKLNNNSNNNKLDIPSRSNNILFNTLDDLKLSEEDLSMHEVYNDPQELITRLSKIKHTTKQPIWVDLECNDETFEMIAEHFRPKIHPLTIEDCISEACREKLEIFDHYLFCSIIAPTNDLEVTIRISLIVFRTIILTYHNGPCNVLRHTRDMVNKRHFPQIALNLFSENSGIDWLCPKPGWVCHAIIDGVVDALIPLVESCVDEIENIEEIIFLLDIDSQNELLQRIQKSRVRLSEFRHLLFPKSTLSHNFNNLSWRTFLKEVPSPYWRDINDHVTRMVDSLQLGLQTLESLQNIFIAKVSAEMSRNSYMLSETAGKLGGLGAVFLPLSLISGIWGMNCWVPFQYDDSNSLLPRKHQEWGFLIVIGIMIILSIITYQWVKIKGYMDPTMKTY